MMKFVFAFLGALVVGALILFLLPYGYRFRTDSNTVRFNEKLSDLAEKSLQSRDVPVSALLVYKDSIIGSGYNTVMRDGNAGGHAEINALSGCLRKMGLTQFRQLDRNSLVLITTFEPCAMCRGAIEEYNIKKVVFALPKSFGAHVGMMKSSIDYYLGLRENGQPELQYDLFLKHPDFDPEEYPR